MEFLLLILILIIIAFITNYCIDKRYNNKVTIDKASHPYKNPSQYVWKDNKPAFKLDSKYYK